VLLLIVVVIVIVVSRRAITRSPFRGAGPMSFGSQAAEARAGLQDKLDEWVVAGIIEPGQGEAILAHEAEQASRRSSRVPIAAEAVGYIGSGLIFASVALLIGNRWDDLSTAGRIASLVVPTAAAAVAGWWAGRSEEPALGRLGSVLWFLAVVGVVGTAVEIWVDAIHDGDPPGHHAALFVGSIGLVAAGLAWRRRPLELQQLALFGTTITAVLGVIDSVAASQDRTMEAIGAGLGLVGVGVLWVALSVARRLPPALLANVSGAALVLFGAQLARADMDQVGLWTGIGASMALLAVGVARTELELLFVGTAGLFQWTPQIALFYLEDTLGAEATLFVIGVLLISVAGLLTRMVPLVKSRQNRARGREEPTAV
jgi:hypothetical protein